MSDKATKPKSRALTPHVDGLSEPFIELKQSYYGTGGLGLERRWKNILGQNAGKADSAGTRSIGSAAQEDRSMVRSSIPRPVQIDESGPWAKIRIVRREDKDEIS